jgi:hypothetical protein
MTFRHFLGEGPHEPIAPRRWTTSAGIDGIGYLGLVLGHAKQSLHMRFGLLHHNHHSSIVGHSPDQPSRTSSSRNRWMGFPRLVFGSRHFLGLGTLAVTKVGMESLCTIISLVDNSFSSNKRDPQNTLRLGCIVTLDSSFLQIRLRGQLKSSFTPLAKNLAICSSAIFARFALSFSTKSTCSSDPSTTFKQPAAEVQGVEMP